jgi:hypothetical protein
VPAAGETLLSTTTITGNMGLSNIPQGYRSLRLVLDKVQMGSTASAYIECRNGSTVLTAKYAGFYPTSNSWLRMNSTNIYWNGTDNIDSADTISTSFQIFNYSNPGTHKPFDAYGGFKPVGSGGFGELMKGVVYSDLPIDTLVLIFNASVTSGTAYLYGAN